MAGSQAGDKQTLAVEILNRCGGLVEDGLVAGNDSPEGESLLGEGSCLVEADQLKLATHVDPSRREAVDSVLPQSRLNHNLTHIGLIVHPSG